MVGGYSFFYMSKFKISTDGENWKEVVSSPNDSFGDCDVPSFKTATYIGKRPILVADDGQVFVLEEEDGDTMEIGKKYDIQLPQQ